MSDRFYLCKEKLTGQFTTKTPTELQRFNPTAEYHTTICSYSDEIVQYMQEHRHSPAGYSGKCYGENYMLDVDQPILKREGKLLAARVAKWLESKNLEYYLFTSGNKGYHFYVPASQIEIPEEVKERFNICNRQFRNLIAQEIGETSPIFTKAKNGEMDNAAKIDEQIYGMISTIRYPFSKHPTTGYRKMNLKYTGHDEGDFKENECFSVLNDSAVKIKIYDRTDTPAIKLQLKVDLTVLKTTITGSENPKTAAIPYGEPMCIYNMKAEKNQTGNRRVMGLRLVSYYRSKGFSFAETESLITSWSETLTKPMSKTEVGEIMKSFDIGYKFSCEDNIKKQYCTHMCIFFQAKETNTSNSWEGGTHAENFYKFKKGLREVEGMNELNLSMLYPAFDKLKLNALMGQILVLCAASGVGKTTILINIMSYFHWINFLVFSYDMAKEEFIERMMIMKGLDVEVPADRVKFDREITNIDIIDDPEIMLGAIETHKTRMERKTNKRYHAIVYDYLDYIPVEGKTDDFARNSHIAKTLRKISKRTKTIQIMLVQVPKEKGGNGNLPLDMTAPANSSNITNVCHVMLTFWRPYKGLQGKQDNVMDVCVAKYRAGRSDYTIRLSFIGEKYQLKHIPVRRTNGNQANNGGTQTEVQNTGERMQDVSNTEGSVLNPVVA